MAWREEKFPSWCSRWQIWSLSCSVFQLKEKLPGNVFDRTELAGHGRECSKYPDLLQFGSVICCSTGIFYNVQLPLDLLQSIVLPWVDLSDLTGFHNNGMAVWFAHLLRFLIPQFSSFSQFPPRALANLNLIFCQVFGHFQIFSCASSAPLGSHQELHLRSILLCLGQRRMFWVLLVLMIGEACSVFL